MTNWLGESSDFHDARARAIFHASMLAASSTAGFTLNDVCQVINAYASVGIGDADCDGTADSDDPDNDDDGVSDGNDNCKFVANSAQADADGDDIGDACDADYDGDGFVGSADNCPWTSNPSQADFDLDGKGDVCDDSDIVRAPLVGAREGHFRQRGVPTSRAAPPGPLGQAAGPRRAPCGSGPEPRSCAGYARSSRAPCRAA